MSREETTRACLTLRSSQLEALKSLSKETGAPVAELARRAIDGFLASRLDGYVPGTPLFESAPTPSTNHT
jgi:Ribbon-helix-helix domain